MLIIRIRNGLKISLACMTPVLGASFWMRHVLMTASNVGTALFITDMN